jgi:hypothetical protein
MMLSEEAEGTPSSDLLVERAAEFDELSIGIPTSTPVMEITYDAKPALVPRHPSNYTGKRSRGSACLNSSSMLTLLFLLDRSFDL